MPQDAAKNHPPGGKRIGHIEQERRLEAVAQLLAAGHPRLTLLAVLARKFNMKERTVDDYIAEVKQRWSAAGAPRLQESRGMMLQRVNDLGIKLERQEIGRAHV